MNESEARSVADALGGEPWPMGDGIWVVRKTNMDGRLVIVSADTVREYPDDAAYRRGKATREILLS